MDNFQDLFNFAVRIEENGIAFYQQGAERAQDQRLQLLFTYLADEEAAHRNSFLQLQKDSHTFSSANSETMDSFLFLRAFINNVVFSPELAQIRETLAEPRALLRFALQRESESILYYEEIKRLFSDQVHAVLDKFIQEEIRHYLKLSDLLEKF